MPDKLKFRQVMSYVYSNQWLKKNELVLRLKALHQPVYSNLKDSACFVYTYNGSKLSGSIEHGILRDRNTTTLRCYMQVKGKNYLWFGESATLVKLTYFEQKQLGYR